MITKKSACRIALFSLSMTAMAFTSTSSLAADQAPKTHYEMPMSKAAFFSDLGKKVNSEFNELFHLLLDRAMLEDPQQRAARLELVRPRLFQYQSDIKALAVAYPNDKYVGVVASGIDAQTLQRLALLGDEDSIKQLNADAAGTDVAKSLQAQSLLLENQWTMAGGRAEGETQVADALDKLDHAHPESQELTAITMKLSGEAGSSTVHERLLELAVGMDNPVASKMDGMKKLIERKKAMAGNIGKPFVLTGKTSDGKDFTTADWKGKVVMVDFWATWCGPCKAELPAIEKFYAENHDKGLEIVGVSNDFDPKALADYTAKNNMPWTQLLDQDAAKKHSWNPTTLSFGIDAIPRLFIIGKNGNLLTMTGRQNYEEVVTKALAEK